MKLDISKTHLDCGFVNEFQSFVSNISDLLGSFKIEDKESFLNRDSDRFLNTLGCVSLLFFVYFNC